jgi:hypothetical protein
MILRHKIDECADKMSNKFRDMIQIFRLRMVRRLNTQYMTELTHFVLVPYLTLAVISGPHADCAPLPTLPHKYRLGLLTL